jgi:hypothetical protein
MYFSPSKSERDISTSAKNLIYLNLILNLNHTAENFCKNKWMFWFKVFSLFWLQKQKSRTRYVWTLLLYLEELAYIREHE